MLGRDRRVGRRGAARGARRPRRRRAVPGQARRPRPHRSRPTQAERLRRTAVASGAPVATGLRASPRGRVSRRSRPSLRRTLRATRRSRPQLGDARPRLPLLAPPLCAACGCALRAPRAALRRLRSVRSPRRSGRRRARSPGVGPVVWAAPYDGRRPRARRGAQVRPAASRWPPSLAAAIAARARCPTAVAAVVPVPAAPGPPPPPRLRPGAS